MNKKKFGLTLSLLCILMGLSSVEAKEYATDRNGNVNINVIDGVVMVNDQVESVLHPDEQLSVDIDGDSYEDYGISVDDEVDVMVESEGYGISVDDEVSVDIGNGGIGINVDDEISVDLGGLLDIGSLIMDD